MYSAFLRLLLISKSKYLTTSFLRKLPVTIGLNSNPKSVNLLTNWVLVRELPGLITILKPNQLLLPISLKSKTKTFAHRTLGLPTLARSHQLYRLNTPNNRWGCLD